MTNIQMDMMNTINRNNLVVQSLNHAEGDVNWWLVVGILVGAVAISALLVLFINWLANR